MKSMHIAYYKTDTGKEPVPDWLRELDKPVRLIIAARIKRVSLGNFGDCKRLTEAEGVWELRVDHGAGYRVYFGKHGSEMVVLLTGGDKKSQKQDIAKAKKYWLDYRESIR